MTELPVASVVGIPKPNGSTEWWELTDQWRLKKIDPPSSSMATDAEVAAAIADHATLPDAHHSQDHTHPTHGDINFTGTISAGGEAGLTGSRTIDGHTLTFKNGILVGYEAP